MRQWPGNQSYFFGHIGDSNLHLTVDGHSVPGVEHHAVYAFVYDMLGPLHGSVSAEHGIGSLKREFLPHLALAGGVGRDACDQAGA